MTALDGHRRYRARIVWPAGAERAGVRATDASGRQGVDAIEPATDVAAIPASEGIGSGADAVGAWPERGLLGSQLGPNRNGRDW